VTALVAAELLKLRTVRARWGYLAAPLALGGIGAAGLIAGSTAADRGRASFAVDLADVASVAGIVALVLGIVVVTGEYRHGTITPTLLATPVRERVLAAKWLAAAASGAALAVLALAAVAVVALIWLAAAGQSTPVDAGAAEHAGRVVLQTTLLGLLGVSVGAVVHGQVPALMGGLLWFLVAEFLVAALLGALGADGVAEYLPSAALGAVAGAEGAEARLSFGAGLAVSAAWIAGIGVLGLARTRRADVT
jgi:ABC-2 type transport system permease protein